MNEGEIGAPTAQKEPNQVSDQAQPVEAVVEIGTDGQQTETTTEGVVRADGDPASERSFGNELGVSEQSTGQLPAATTTASAQGERQTADQVPSADLTEQQVKDEAEQRYEQLQQEILNEVNLHPDLSKQQFPEGSSYFQEWGRLFNIIAYQKRSDFVKTYPQFAAVLTEKHPEIAQVIKILEKQSSGASEGASGDAVQSNQENVQPGAAIENGNSQQPVETPPPPEQAAPPEQLPNPYETMSPAQLSEMAALWLQVPENANKAAPAALIEGLRLQLTKHKATVIEQLNATSDQDKKKTALKEGAAIAKQIQQQIIELSDHTKRKMESAPPAVKNAKNPTELDGALNPYKPGDEKFESTESRKEKLLNQITGATGLALHEVDTIVQESDMGLFMTFLFTGADGTYGGGFRSGRKEDPYSSEVKKVSREDFVELLEKKPDQLARVFAQAYLEKDSTEKNLQSGGFWLEAEQKKLLEKWLTSPVDRAEAADKLPAILEAFHQHIISDSSEGQRWHLARRTLGEKIAQTSNVVLDPQSGTDFYMFMEQSMKNDWKYWKT